MKSKRLEIHLDDRRFRLPKKNLDVYLYEYGVEISDSTIVGTRAVTSVGSDSTALQGNNPGNYIFSNIPTNKRYAIVVSGPAVTTQIPEELSEIDIGQAYNVTGSDIPYKNSSNVSIATKIGELGDYSTQYEENPSNDGTLTFETDINLMIIDTTTELDDITIVMPDVVERVKISFPREDALTKTFISDYALLGDTTSKQLEYIFLSDESYWFGI